MLKPINDQVLVKEIEQEEQLDSGIIIPQTASEEHRRGKVVGVGSGMIVDGHRVPLTVEEGDTVLYNEVVAEELTYKGETYYMLRIRGILGTIEEEKDTITVTIELDNSVASTKEGLKQSLQMALDDLDRWSDQEEFQEQLLENKDYHLLMTQGEGYTQFESSNE